MKTKTRFNLKMRQLRRHQRENNERLAASPEAKVMTSRDWARIRLDQEKARAELMTEFMASRTIVVNKPT